ncbi:MAG: RNA polymerase sigma-70 factor [Chitinophagaceae bacterium]|nr:RNA polymerase sigma-70 factor [Chitinophagaceae bacterium]
MTRKTVYVEHEMLLLLNTGSEFAFTQIFNHYRGRIYAVALKFLKSPAPAEEIVQDVFLKIWLKRYELHMVENFEAYLFTMARNFIFDRLKKMAYETAAQSELRGEETAINDTEYLVRQRQCLQLEQEAIQLLPPQQKLVYHFSKTEGLSHETIAQKMQLSRLTVKTHMAKALQSIRKYLNRHLHQFLMFAIGAFTVIFPLL